MSCPIVTGSLIALFRMVQFLSIGCQNHTSSSGIPLQFFVIRCHSYLSGSSICAETKPSSEVIVKSSVVVKVLLRIVVKVLLRIVVEMLLRVVVKVLLRIAVEVLFLLTRGDYPTICK